MTKNMRFENTENNEHLRLLEEMFGGKKHSGHLD